MPIKDKNKKREYDRDYYKKMGTDRKAHKVRLQRIRRQYIRDKVNEYLVGKSCLDCGEVDRDVLDFDHVLDSKVNNVSDLIVGGNSLVYIMLEISKCEIRCANCHRRKTARQRRSQAQVQPL